MGKRIGIDDLRAVLAQMPRVSEPFLREGLAQVVLLELIPGRRGDVARLYNALKGASFYRETTDDGVYRIPRHECLANALLAVQGVPGFDAYITAPAVELRFANAVAAP